MIVECFGLPGAGKTTLVARLSKGDRFHAPPKYVSKSYACSFMVRHPVFFVQYTSVLLSESFRPGSFSLLRFKFAVFLNTIARFRYAQRNYSRDDFVLLDEGVAQRLLSLSERARTAAWYQRLLCSSVLGDVLLHVVNTDMNEQNVKIGSRRKMLGEVRIKKWRKTLIANHTAISNTFVRIGVPVCEYTRSTKGETATDELITCITKVADR